MLPRLLLALAFAACLGASAIDAFDFADAETAARYQHLIASLRCPKCLNESLASSAAPIAVDLRRTVRRLIEEGRSDADIRAHLQARYGDFVLYDPPFKPSTWLLWLSPLALAGVAGTVLYRVARNRAAPASTDERTRARELLARTAPPDNGGS